MHATDGDEVRCLVVICTNDLHFRTVVILEVSHGLELGIWRNERRLTQRVLGGSTKACLGLGSRMG